MRGALAAGAIAGFLVAGLGSRIAMRLIFLADKGTEGILTSDQFIVGRISTDTFNLLALGTIIGVLVAPIYLGLRRWLPIPTSLRGLGFGYGSLVTGGMILINDDSVDFRIFEPVVLESGCSPDFSSSEASSWGRSWTGFTRTPPTRSRGSCAALSGLALCWSPS